MWLRLALAFSCFLFALHEHFVGLVEGASVESDWIGGLTQGEPAAGVPLLVAFGFFLIYYVGMKWRESSRR